MNSLLLQELQLQTVVFHLYRDPIRNVLDELKSFNIKDTWREKWLYDTPFNYEIITDSTLPKNAFKLDRDIWVKLNCFRTGHGRCLDYLFKMEFYILSIAGLWSWHSNYGPYNLLLLS